ncbi:MAG: PorV/PorQ family protein [Elusimicrobiales bacterium]|nr:PorV/PorQ family protein [Elusimicrobiales bacterium]
MLKICVLALFAFTATAADCAAAGSEGTSGGQFLRIGVGARASALGEAASTSSGAQSIFYNPAGLAGVMDTELYFSQVQWIMDASYSNLALAKRAWGGVFGLGINYLSNPATDKYDKFGTKLSETYSASDMAVTLGYSGRLALRTNFGANLKYISSKLEDEAASAVTMDAGVKYAAIPGKLVFGFALQNVGGTLTYINDSDPLPLNVKLGGQYAISLDKNSATKKDLTVFTDVNSMKDSGPYANIGVDLTSVYDKDTNFSMRVGYRTKAGPKSAGVAGGIGVDMKKYIIDYAYAPMGDLGNTHRFSVTVKFGAKKAE